MKRLCVPLLYLLSLVFNIAPLLVYLVFNSEKYISSVPDALKLSCGGAIALVILALKCLGKLKVPSRFTFFALILVLSYLLEPLLQDLTVISFLALVGEVCDMIIQIFIRRLRQRAQTLTFAKESAKEIEKIMSRA